MPIDPINDAEKRLVETAQAEKFADFRTHDAVKDDPAKGEDWGDDRTVRAALIRDLMVNANERGVHAKGVRLLGARITGSLDLENTDLEHPLYLHGCHFQEPPVFKGARTRSISLYGSALPGIRADGLRVDGFLFLRKARITGEVRLPAAHIDGDLDCRSARFEAGDPDLRAFSGDRMKVTGLFLWRLESPPSGTVCLEHACVGQLVDDAGSWPSKGKLDLDGFTYGSIAWRSPVTAAERLPWLELQMHLDGKNYLAVIPIEPL